MGRKKRPRPTSPIRRFPDASIAFEPHDDLTRLAARALLVLKENSIGLELEGLNVVVVLHDERTKMQGVGATIPSARSATEAFAGVAVSLAESLGQMGRIAPGMNPLIREQILRLLVDA